MIDAATALAFSLYENKGVYALLLGSGVSRAAAIPTGWEITLDLARRVGRLEGAPEQADWAAWHQTRFGEPPNYAKLLDAVSTTPDERRAILHSYIVPTAEEHAEGLKTPTKAHRAIAKLIRDGFIRVVITTNFDRLLETALRDLGVEPTVIKSDDDLKGAVPLIHSQCFILKVHGDYLDTRLRNTESELAGYSDDQNKCLDRILDEHGLIACGWSADWDEALRASIVRAPARRYPMYWASRGAPSPIAADLIAQRAGKVVTIAGTDEFFETLQSQVEVQADLKRPHPDRVELLVATLKRYLSSPQHRIQLADLIDTELVLLRQRLSGEDLPSNGRSGTEEFVRRVEVFEAASERLMHLAYHLGRWGQGAEFELMGRLLNALFAERQDNGVTLFLELQRYPAVLVFFAYGLGAAHAGRTAAIRAWLTHELFDRHRTEPRWAVEQLYLRAWAGGDQRIWQQMPGLERQKEPLSDHLFGLFSARLSRQFGYAQELKLAWCWFDVLAAISIVERRTTKDYLRKTLDGEVGGHKMAYVPLGQAGWLDDDIELLLRRFKPEHERQALVEAGFASGDPDYLDLLARNVAEVAAYVRW